MVLSRCLFLFFFFQNILFDFLLHKTHPILSTVAAYFCSNRRLHSVDQVYAGSLEIGTKKKERKRREIVIFFKTRDINLSRTNSNFLLHSQVCNEPSRLTISSIASQVHFLTFLEALQKYRQPARLKILQGLYELQRMITLRSKNKRPAKNNLEKTNEDSKKTIFLRIFIPELKKLIN